MTDPGPERTRTVSWESPEAAAGLGATLPGREYLERIRDGEVPQAPMALLLGFDLTVVEDGRVVFEAVPGEHHYNPMNSVHGGLAMTMLDSAAGACVHTTLAAGQFYGTLETKVNLVRAISAGTGPVAAEGKVIHRGSRTATSEARLTAKESGKLLAHATSTVLILGAES